MRFREPRTMAYFARRRAEGLADRDIIRCLKRHIANEVFALLTHPSTEPLPGPLLRRQHQVLSIRLTDAADALGCPINGCDAWSSVPAPTPNSSTAASAGSTRSTTNTSKRLDANRSIHYEGLNSPPAVAADGAGVRPAGHELLLPQPRVPGALDPDRCAVHGSPHAGPSAGHTAPGPPCASASAESPSVPVSASIDGSPYAASPGCTPTSGRSLVGKAATTSAGSSGNWLAC